MAKIDVEKELAVCEAAKSTTAMRNIDGLERKVVWDVSPPELAEFMNHAIKNYEQLLLRFKRLQEMCTRPPLPGDYDLYCELLDLEKMP